MHARAAFLTVLAGAGLLAGATPPPYRIAQLAAPERGQLPYEPGQLIVQFKASVDAGVVARAIRDVGGRSARQSQQGDRYLVTLEAGLPEAVAVARLVAQPEVDYAELNGVVRAHHRPNDSAFPLQWHLPQIGAERTWDIQQGDPSVTIAVLDTGIAYEDFGPFRKAPDWGNVGFVGGFNVFTRDTHANDDNFHGTHVASIIAEGTDNQIGAAGLAFRCTLMPVKVLDSEGEGSFFGVAEGIDHAIDSGHGVKVINLSLGGETESTTVSRAIARAVGAGIVVVASAGNDGVNEVSYPARDPNVIAVGAVDARNRLAPYSNFGADLDIVAPGGDLDRDDSGDGRPDGILQQTFDPRTAAFEGRYDDFALFFVVGTSQAAPQVAAVAALLVQQGITDPRAVRHAIQSTALDLGAAGRDDDFGHGLIQPAKALTGLGLNK